MVVGQGYAERVTELRQDFVPKAAYSDPAIPALEREKLWPKVWLIACREEEIPKVGNYIVFDIANESFLVVRTAEEEITAFYNVCTHRGRRLKTDRKGTLANGVTCPFHAWRFDLEGKVRNVPHAKAWEGCSELNPYDLSLARPRTDRWGGWVWITMNPEAPPLLEALSPAAETLRHFELENTRLDFYKTLHMPMDWKFVLEAFIEGYHTLGTHPQILRYGEMSWEGELDQGVNTAHTITVNKIPETMDARERFHALVVEIAETLHGMFLEPGVAAVTRLLELPKGSSEEEVFAAYWQFHREELEKRGARWPETLEPEHLHNTMWHIFPNISILPTIDGAFCYRMRPDPEKEGGSILDIWSLGRFAPGKEPVVEHEVYPSLEAFKGVNPFLEQDFSNLLAVSKGTQSRAWAGANLNPLEEATVYHFQKNMRAHLTAGD